MATFKDVLQSLVTGITFNSQQAYSALQSMLLPETPDTQRAAFLALLAARGETTQELIGFLQYLKQHSLTVSFDQSQPVIDIVGTGGDALKTFNISTAAALVVAAAGVNVAKHGGRSVTSLSGSADVISALHIPRFEDATAITHSLQRYHFAFLFAPFFNPILKQVSDLRRELGIRTFFNLLAPLANPLQVQRQVLGLYAANIALKIVEALKAAGSIQVMAVHSLDGMDEISLSSPTQIVHLHQDKIKTYTVQPEDFGLATCDIAEVMGGNADDNATIIRNIFAGEECGAKRDIVVLNAAAGLIVADRVANFAEGIALAKHTIANGSALSLLNHLGDASYA